ncbi:hypothetical protein [Tenacibaculum sp. MAR_2010_89]|uniref:hypothetical protein n=1 Tax=Tenacibaculum sp. MAR_2010_89 TaxID=1250198 RepID=UPI00115F7D91|nr:hypothetical protein [Tenacibaculum sp. MAR_2010_89]
MMETILLLVVLPLVLLVIGYIIWQSAMDSYGYNIFSIWVLVRLLIAVVCGFVDLYLGITLFVLFSIWSFIATWRNTSMFIAILAVIFQPIALLFAFSALNRLSKALND